MQTRVSVSYLASENRNDDTFPPAITSNVNPSYHRLLRARSLSVLLSVPGMNAVFPCESGSRNSFHSMVSHSRSSFEYFMLMAVLTTAASVPDSSVSTGNIGIGEFIENYPVVEVPVQSAYASGKYQ